MRPWEFLASLSAFADHHNGMQLGGDTGGGRGSASPECFGQLIVFVLRILLGFAGKAVSDALVRLIPCLLSCGERGPRLLAHRRRFRPITEPAADSLLA